MPERVVGQLISLASRRRAAIAPHDHAPDRPEPRPLRRRPVLALSAGVVFLALAVVAGAHSRSVAEIRALSPGDRARIFRRALEDMKASCGAPDLAVGPLRDHCRAQGEFLTLFPECDQSCRTIAAAVLPHAKR